MSKQKIDSKVMRAFRQAHRAGLVTSPPPPKPEYNLRRSEISLAVSWVCAHWGRLNHG